MKSFTPTPGVSTSRAFLASLLTCIILVTPLAPVGYAATNTSLLLQTRSKSAAKQQTAPKPDAPAQAEGQKGGPVPAAIAASDITATKTDTIVGDSLGDGKAQAGDIINYSITVTNNSATDTATGVVLNDTVDTNTTIVADSIHAQPQARNDAYTAVGNTLLEAGLAAPSGDPAVTTTVKVFDNDSAATDPSTLDTFQNPSANGGTVTLNADGSFSYLPPAGFTGTDTFTYTVSNTAVPSLTDTATVTITVANRVWYVNNEAAGGDGRSGRPFQTLAQVNGAGGAGDSDGTGDYIYLYTGNAGYTTGLTLESDQQLIGNGVALVVNGNTLRAAGTRPTLSNGAGNALTLAAGSNTQGLNLTAAANAAIFGSGISGTVNVADASITTSGTGTGVSLTNQAGTFNYSGGTTGSSLTGNSSGTAVLVSGGNGNITFSGVPVTQNSGRAVDIQTRTGGTVAFNNGSTVTQTAGSTDSVVLRNNTGGSSINFSNNVNLTTSAGRGLFTDNSTGNFTLNMNAAGNSISAAGGAAIDVEDITADLDFVTLSSINSVAAGGSQGIRIFNITGSVTVTTGTTVSNSAATGVGVQSSNAAVAFATLNSAPAAGQIALLVQTNSGTTSATGGTVTATDAAAISVLNSPLGLTLTSVSADNTGDSDPAITLNGMTGTLVMSGGAIIGGNAQAFLANAQNGSITYNGTISQANAFRAVEVTNKTGGTVNFGGQISATNGAVAGAGVFLNANGNTTFNFTGGLNLSTGVGDAFTATGGGTVNATQNNGAIVNTLATTTGTALNVTNTNIGASGLTFRSINSNTAGAKNGVILNTTGTTAGTNGGLTITGNGGTCASAGSCTGGNIANKTSGADASATEGTGIYLKDTRDVNLTNVFLNDFANYAIYGNNVTNFTFTTSRVSGSNGTSSNPINEGCVRFDGLLGNALITGSSIGNTNTAGGATNALHVNNASGTLTLLDVQNSTIFNQNGNATPANSGQDAFFFGSPSGATGVMNLRMNNTQLTHARQFLLQVNIQGTKTSNLEITNNTLHNQIPSVVNAGGGSNITGGGTDVYVKYTISGNSFRHTPGVTNGGRSLTIGHASGNAAFDGRFINNTIGQTGVVSSGAGNAADALGIFASGNNSPTFGGSKALIQGNTIQRYGEAGILVNARQGNATLDTTILGNIIREPGTAALGAFAGIWVNSGALPADTNIVNVVIGSATVAANKNTLTNTDPSNATDVFLDKNTCGGCASQLRLYQNGSDAAGATIEDKVRDVLVDDNIGPLDLLAGFTNASAITLVAAGLPAQPTVANIGSDDGAEGQVKLDPAAAHDAAVAAAARAVPVRSDLTNAAAPVFIGARVAAAQPVAVNRNAQQQAASGVKQDRDVDSKAAKTPGVQPAALSAFPVNLGDLGPGESVTVIFSVKVADVLPSSVTEISNQGQITGTNFAGTVLTDDPAAAGANNPTVTPVLGLPTVNINNASATEPTSGAAAPMPFTVSLSHAYGSPVTVNYSTADGTATAGTDYTAASGLLAFSPGESLRTISVDVLADGDASETDEDFTVTLNTPANAILGSASTATGTITTANPPGTVLISEVRTSGPGGADDEFVELYNNTDAPIDISGWAIVKSGATCDAMPVVTAVIPPSTTIPARGHYLVVGPSYSLGTSATPNLTITPDLAIEDDRNVGLFNTSSLASLSTATRLDAVGFFDGVSGLGGTCDLLREGTPLNAAQGSTSQYSFFRKLSSGKPQDTGRSVDDFQIASTTPAVAVGFNATPALGAPGAENLASPVQRNATIKASLIDPMVAVDAPPNRVRSSFGANPTNAAFGTLSIQRRFKNTLGVAVTRLRFRVVDITTYNNRVAGNTDLRVLSSTGAVTNSAGTVVATVNGLTLEQPPQPNGGGLNSTLTVALPGGGLAPGNSIDVQFLLGVQEQGTFKFFVNVEALPNLEDAGISEATRATKSNTTAKQRDANAGGAATQKQ